jgi:hypothetical protein
MARISRPARNGAQRGRTIEPAVDFQAAIAAEQASRRTVVKEAVCAEQTIIFGRQVRSLPAFTEDLLHAPNSP